MESRNEQSERQFGRKNAHLLASFLQRAPPATSFLTHSDGVRGEGDPAATTARLDNRVTLVLSVGFYNEACNRTSIFTYTGSRCAVGAQLPFGPTSDEAV